MQMIAYEPHFWELYQQAEEYYLSIAIDMSSVISCWDLVLTPSEILCYQSDGRDFIQKLTAIMVKAVYRGNLEMMEARLASPSQQQAMLLAFKQAQTRGFSQFEKMM